MSFVSQCETFDQRNMPWSAVMYMMQISTALLLYGTRLAPLKWLVNLWKDFFGPFHMYGIFMVTDVSEWISWTGFFERTNYTVLWSSKTIEWLY